VILKGGPGTGKTFLLKWKLMELVKSKVWPNDGDILYVTNSVTNVTKDCRNFRERTAFDFKDVSAVVSMGAMELTSL
jgi:hypothetical protein